MNKKKKELQYFFYLSTRVSGCSRWKVNCKHLEVVRRPFFPIQSSRSSDYTSVLVHSERSMCILTQEIQNLSIQGIIGI